MRVDKYDATTPLPAVRPVNAASIAHDCKYANASLISTVQCACLPQALSSLAILCSLFSSPLLLPVWHLSARNMRNFNR